MLKHTGDIQSDTLEYQPALESDMDLHAAAYNQARLLQDGGELEQCCHAYRALLARAPHCGKARLNLGNALVALGDSEQAVAEYRAAVALLPNSADAHLSLGLALLRSRNWKEGWQEFEWRLRQPGPRRKLVGARWEGSPIQGKRIFIHAEQELGDTVQFSRFATLVSDMGAEVLLECPGPLTRLLSTLDGVDGVMPAGGRIPECDYHAPLMSLPAILGITPDDLAGDTPYLFRESDLVERWSALLLSSLDPSLFRVGLAWAGNSDNKIGPIRPLTRSDIDVLAGLPGIAFFNLQQPSDSNYSPGLTLFPMLDRCTDFADLAAAILNLDLVIAVDATVAHLAGALGKPVWTLLPYAADWRWMLHRDDSPWYPSMRLFRQAEAGGWPAVLGKVRTELQKIT